MRLLGLVCVAGYYLLCAYHTSLYFEIILPILLRRWGSFKCLAWTAMLLTFLFFALINHFLAWIVKPGSPRDLLKPHKIKKEITPEGELTVLKSYSDYSLYDLRKIWFR